MSRRFDRNAFFSWIPKIWPEMKHHIPVVGFAVVVVIANIFWGAHTSELASSGITIPVEKITTAQIQTMLAYFQDYVPPLESPNRTQNTYALFADGNLFLNKPILTNTVISDLPRERIVTYTVADGDTIYTVAYRYEVSVETVAWANNIDVTTPIKTGQKLRIPPVNGLIYAAADGDTVENLARTFRISAESITQQNKLTAAITPGQELILPGAKKYTAPSSTPGTQIIAAPGETVWGGQVLAGSGSWVWPITSQTKYITQYYGWVTRSYKHTGLDLDSRNGLDIVASDQGTVVAIGGGWGGGYGNHIVIDHGNGYQTLYAHLSGILVNVGDNVSTGQKIGIMGTTGFSTGVHLHFELRLNGVAQNPLAYFK